MVISTRVGNGSKEDAFGFFPHPSYPSRAIIGGPSGAVSSEFVKDASRFSRVTVSMQRPISDAQRRTILNHIDQWNARDYKLTSESCIDFVVRSRAGLVGTRQNVIRLTYPKPTSGACAQQTSIA